MTSGCIDLLEGREVDDGLVLALGGGPAEYVLEGYEGGTMLSTRWSTSGTIRCQESERRPGEQSGRSRLPDEPRRSSGRVTK